MSATNKVDLCPLPVDGTLLDVAERADHGLLATTSSSAKHNTLQVWAASRGGTDYDCVASWRSKEIITRLAWAHPEFGPVLAGCSDSGTISIFIQQQPSSAAPDDEDDDEGGHPVFSLATTLKAGEKPIRCCCFAPRQHGLLLAAGSDDGFVYVFEADQQLQPRSWTLQSQFQVGASGAGPVPLRSLSWRPFSLGAPPMLAAGTTQGASVWHYLAPAMAWHTLCALPLPSPQAPVAALHWAPNLSGSSRERLAAAQGRTVAIVSLTAAPPAAPSAAGEGEGSGPLRGELLAELPHGAEVWRVEWDLLGSCLAAGTEDGRLCLWKADLAGGWAPYGQLVGEDVEAATAMAAD